MQESSGIPYTSAPNYILTNVRRGANYILVDKALFGNRANEWQRLVDPTHPLIQEMVFVVCHGDTFGDCLKFDS